MTRPGSPRERAAWRRVLLAAALAGGVSTACSKQDPQIQPTGLERVLDTSLGGGRPAVTSATGPMDLDLASRATAVPPGAMRSYLKQHGFQGGYSRVWKRDSEVVTALGYHFFAERDARAFVGWAADLLESGRFDTPQADPLVPGSRALTLVSRVQGRTRFCAIELFDVNRDAFVLTSCAEHPVPVEEVIALAHRQLVRAVTGSVATPAPSAGPGGATPGAVTPTATGSAP